MDKDDSLDTSGLSVGQEFKSFPALCRFLNQPVKANRKSQEKHFRQYFEWAKSDRGNALTISSIREHPVVKWLNPAAKFDKHILIAFSNLINDGASHQYTSSQILAMCGLVNQTYLKAKRDLDVLEAYSLETDQSRKQALRIYNRLDTHVKKYFWRDKIKEGLKRLCVDGFIEYREVLNFIKANGESGEADSQEKAAYDASYNEVKEELGIVGSVNLHNRARFNGRIDERIREELGWRKVYTMQEVAYNPEISDPLVETFGIDYRCSLLEANSKALAMLGNPIDEAVMKEIEKELMGFERADADTKEIIKLFYTLSDYLEHGYGASDRRVLVRYALVEHLILLEPSRPSMRKAGLELEQRKGLQSRLERIEW